MTMGGAVEMELARRPKKQPAENDNATSTYSTVAFVDCSNPRGRKSAATKRLIHQHAMKEIGKSRRKPKPVTTVELTLEPLERAKQIQLSWWLGVRCTLDPFVKFPIELDARGKELIAFVFCDDDGQQRPLRDAWFTVGLQGKAAFLQILSNSALHMSAARGRGAKAIDSASSTHYHAQAIACIRDQMKSDKVNALEAVIGAVTGMMAHADIRGAAEDWKTHHRGLQDLVRLRGGIDQLESNEALRTTVSWCELRGVYFLDMMPCYPLPRQWHKYGVPPIPSAQTRAHIERLRYTWDRELPGHSEWLDLYADLAAFSFDTFQGLTHKPHSTMVSSDFGAWASNTIHRFLSWRPLISTSSRAAVIQEACRLGALIYMVPVWRFFGVAPVVSGYLVSKLRAFLKMHFVDWGNLWRLQVWVLYVAGLEAHEGREEQWFYEQLAWVLKLNGIASWDDAMTCVYDVLWFDCLFAGKDDMLKTEVAAMLDADIDV